MSYGQSAALQTAIYGILAADTVLSARVDGAIYDALPAGTPPATFITLGPEDVRPRGDKAGRGALHRFLVTVTTTEAGFGDAKETAAMISDLLDGATPALTRGAVSFLRFRRARARRLGTGDQRQIEMTFEARLEDD